MFLGRLEEESKRIKRLLVTPMNSASIVLFTSGSKSKNSFRVTFLNLVKKGVFRIEKTTNEVGKETDKIVFQKNVPGLKEYQKNVAKKDD